MAIVLLKILKFRWNGPGERSGMAVMEVDLPSGYKTSPEVLINLVEKLKLTTTLRAAETDYFKNIFYFDYVSLGLCCTHCLCADNH